MSKKFNIEDLFSEVDEAIKKNSPDEIIKENTEGHFENALKLFEEIEGMSFDDEHKEKLRSEINEFSKKATDDINRLTEEALNSDDEPGFGALNRVLTYLSGFNYIINSEESIVDMIKCQAKVLNSINTEEKDSVKFRESLHRALINYYMLLDMLKNRKKVIDKIIKIEISMHNDFLNMSDEDEDDEENKD